MQIFYNVDFFFQLLEYIFTFLTLPDKLQSQLVCKHWQDIIRTISLINDIQVVFNDCCLNPTAAPVQVFARSPIAYRNLLIGNQVVFPALSDAQEMEMNNFWFWFGRGIKRLIFQYSDRLTVEDVVKILKNIPRLEEMALVTNVSRNNFNRTTESGDIFLAYKNWRKEIFTKKIYALQEDSISKIRRIKINVIC